MPLLSRLETITVGVSIVGATLLHFWRERNGRKTDTGQWFADALSVGTMIILLIIGVEAITGDRWGFDPIVRSNGLLIEIALINSIGTIARTLYRSVRLG